MEIPAYVFGSSGHVVAQHGKPETPAFRRRCAGDAQPDKGSALIFNPGSSPALAESKRTDRR